MLAAVIRLHLNRRQLVTSCIKLSEFSEYYTVCVGLYHIQALYVGIHALYVGHLSIVSGSSKYCVGSFEHCMCRNFKETVCESWDI